MAKKNKESKTQKKQYKQLLMRRYLIYKKEVWG